MITVEIIYENKKKKIKLSISLLSQYNHSIFLCVLFFFSLSWSFAMSMQLVLCMFIDHYSTTEYLVDCYKIFLYMDMLCFIYAFSFSVP